MTGLSDISIDLETLGTGANAPIVAIGAVEFDVETGDLGDTFYAVTEPDDFSGLTFSTVCWWMTQSDDARSLFARENKHVPITDALEKLRDFVGIETRVWGNGATFDITILEYHYGRLFNDIPPWRFRNIRDMRTIMWSCEEITGIKPSIERYGTHHNAIDDAEHQAKLISTAYRLLKGEQDTTENATWARMTQ